MALSFFPKPEDIQLIACDIDGTLLDSHLVLSTASPTYRVLKRIRAERPHLPIVLTTGKTLTAATPHRHALDLVSFPTCTLNGNVVYDPSGKIIQEFMLPVTVVEEVYAKCRAAGVNLFLFDRENAYHVLPFKTFTDAQGDRLLSKYGENIVHIRHAATVLQKVRAGAVNVISMAICEAEAYIPHVRTLLTHFPPAHFTVVQSQTFCIQLIPPHGHKGNALLRVIDYLNATRTVGSRLIVPERTLVFGDGENDVAMFEVAGMSVAMGNAVDVAKSKARWTTTTNDEGGVGRFLEKVFFPRD